LAWNQNWQAAAGWMYSFTMPRPLRITKLSDEFCQYQILAHPRVRPLQEVLPQTLAPRPQSPVGT
jgi:hypothetical protein